MLGKLDKSDELELGVRRQLRVAVMEEMDRKRLSLEDLAQQLGVFPSTVMTLWNQDPWPLETAFKIATRLGLIVTVSVGKQR